jgi:glutathionylspermidine synthase
VPVPSVLEVRALGELDPLSDPRLRRDLAHRYLVWDAFVAGERRVDLHPLLLPRESHERAVRAAEEVTRLVGLVASRAHDDPEERARYRVPACVEELAAASHAAGDDAIAARVDLLLGEDGEWHACEINADCPGGYNEAHGLPRLALEAGLSGVHDPTHVTDVLVDRLASLARGRAVGLVYATAYAEDLQVCALLQRLLSKRGVPSVLVPPTAPRLHGSELVARGERLGVLYRFYPAEYMEGQANVGDVVRAIRSGAVRTLTGFSHIYAQSKLAFARAWAHAGAMDPASRASLAAYVPRSLDAMTVPAAELARERADWVLKRAYGRVGDEVLVGALFDDASWVDAVATVRGLCAKGESWIAQRFVRQRTVPTPWGERFVTLGAYVLDGRFAGYFARITPESHVSHDALCVPVFVRSEARAPGATEAA